MDAIILAGGFGTRLAPLTERTPKPLLPVGNRPFLETLFYRLRAAGTRRVHLSVFHQAGVLRRALPKLRRFGLSVKVVQEPQALGTGGAIAYAWPDKTKPCLVLNGDILSDYNMRELLATHALYAPAATLWAIQVPDTRAFGVIEQAAGGKVRRFVEKPAPGQARGRWVNAGLYALSPAVLSAIPRGRPVSVEREVFPGLLSAGLELRVARSKPGVYWNDIGTPQRYAAAQRDILSGQLFKGGAQAKALWGRVVKGKLVHASARVSKSALIKDSVIGPLVHVGAGARIEGSVLLKGATVAAGAQLRGVILAQGAAVGAEARVGEGVVLGPGQGIAAGAWF